MFELPFWLAICLMMKNGAKYSNHAFCKLFQNLETNRGSLSSVMLTVKGCLELILVFIIEQVSQESQSS